MDISVVIPTYNRYNFLKRAIKSVLNQTFKAKEIIVVDDGSNDNTYKIKDEFKDIKYICYNENKGVSFARNIGILNAKYDYVAFLDSDDEWHKDKLKEQVDFFKKNKDYLICYTDEKWIRGDVVVNVPKKYQKYGGDIFKECLEYCIIAPSSVMMHKKLFNSVGLFDESLEVCEDYDLWLRVANSYKIGLVDKKLIIKYAQADNQLSMKYWGMDRFRVKSLEKLYNISDKKELIANMLVKKYNLLLKGAKKHNRDFSKYELKIKYYENI